MFFKYSKKIFFPKYILEINNRMDSLRHIFNKFDTEHKGYLTRTQFIRMLIRLKKLRGKEVEHAKTAFEIFDIDGNEQLSFNEFLEWWKCKNRYDYIFGKRADKIGKIYKLFSKYSKEGQMNSYNFYSLQTENIDGSLSIESTGEVFDTLDTDNDGTISFPEFLEWMES